MPVTVPVRDYSGGIIDGETVKNGTVSSSASAVANPSTISDVVSNSSAVTASDYDSIDELLRNLKDKDKDFTDTYLNWLMENYFVNSARAYDEKMSNTAFSRLVDDIKKAGYNPWLALQNNFGQASHSFSSAGSVKSATLSSKVSRANNKETNSTKLISSSIQTLGQLIGNVLKFIGFIL